MAVLEGWRTGRHQQRGGFCAEAGAASFDLEFAAGLADDLPFLCVARRQMGRPVSEIHAG